MIKMMWMVMRKTWMDLSFSQHFTKLKVSKSF